MWCGALRGCLALKFKSCNNLPLYIHTKAAINCVCDSLDIKHGKLLLLLLIIIIYFKAQILKCEIKPTYKPKTKPLHTGNIVGFIQHVIILVQLEF